MESVRSFDVHKDISTLGKRKSITPISPFGILSHTLADSIIGRYEAQIGQYYPMGVTTLRQEDNQEEEAQPFKAPVPPTQNINIDLNLQLILDLAGKEVTVADNGVGLNKVLQSAPLGNASYGVRILEKAVSVRRNSALKSSTGRSLHKRKIDSFVPLKSASSMIGRGPLSENKQLAMVFSDVLNRAQEAGVTFGGRTDHGIPVPKYVTYYEEISKRQKPEAENAPGGFGKEKPKEYVVNKVEPATVSVIPSGGSDTQVNVSIEQQQFLSGGEDLVLAKDNPEGVDTVSVTTQDEIRLSIHNGNESDSKRAAGAFIDAVTKAVTETLSVQENKKNDSFKGEGNAVTEHDLKREEAPYVINSQKEGATKQAGEKDRSGFAGPSSEKRESSSEGKAFIIKNDTQNDMTAVPGKSGKETDSDMNGLSTEHAHSLETAFERDENISSFVVSGIEKGMPASGGVQEVMTPEALIHRNDGVNGEDTETKAVPENSIYQSGSASQDSEGVAAAIKQAAEKLGEGIYAPFIKESEGKKEVKVLRESEKESLEKEALKEENIPLLTAERSVPYGSENGEMPTKAMDTLLIHRADEADEEETGTEKVPANVTDKGRVTPQDTVGVSGVLIKAAEKIAEEISASSKEEAEKRNEEKDTPVLNLERAQGGFVKEEIPQFNEGVGLVHRNDGVNSQKTETGEDVPVNVISSNGGATKLETLPEAVIRQAAAKIGEEIQASSFGITEGKNSGVTAIKKNDVVVPESGTVPENKQPKEASFTEEQRVLELTLERSVEDHTGKEEIPKINDGVALIHRSEGVSEEQAAEMPVPATRAAVSEPKDVINKTQIESHGNVAVHEKTDNRQDNGQKNAEAFRSLEKSGTEKTAAFENEEGRVLKDAVPGSEIKLKAGKMLPNQVKSDEMAPIGADMVYTDAQQLSKAFPESISEMGMTMPSMDYGVTNEGMSPEELNTALSQMAGISKDVPSAFGQDTVAAPSTDMAGGYGFVDISYADPIGNITSRIEESMVARASQMGAGAGFNGSFSNGFQGSLNGSGSEVTSFMGGVPGGQFSGPLMSGGEPIVELVNPYVAGMGSDMTYRNSGAKENRPVQPQGTQPQPVARMTDAEIRRSADQIYKIIKEKIKLERRSMGLS